MRHTPACDTRVLGGKLQFPWLSQLSAAAVMRQTKCILSWKLKTLTFFHLFHYRRADCKSWNGNCIICKLSTQHIATSKEEDLAEYRINDMEMPFSNANPLFVLLNQIIVISRSGPGCICCCWWWWRDDDWPLLIIKAEARSASSRPRLLLLHGEQSI